MRDLRAPAPGPIAEARRGNSRLLGGDAVVKDPKRTGRPFLPDGTHPGPPIARCTAFRRRLRGPVARLTGGHGDRRTGWGGGAQANGAIILVIAGAAGRRARASLAETAQRSSPRPSSLRRPKVNVLEAHLADADDARTEIGFGRVPRDIGKETVQQLGRPRFGAHFMGVELDPSAIPAVVRGGDPAESHHLASRALDLGGRGEYRRRRCGEFELESLETAEHAADALVALELGR